MHDDEPLLFKGDEGEPGTPARPGRFRTSGRGRAVRSQPVSPSGKRQKQTDHPVEALAAPLSEEGHDLAAETADGAAPGVAPGVDSKTKPRTRKTAPSDWPSPTRTMAWSTSTSPPSPARQRRGSSPIASLREAAVAAEPAKKKKRKREANPFLRIVGIVVCGLLAVPCALSDRAYAGAKLDFLPSWVSLISHKPSTHANAPKPGGESNTTANGQTPANATPTGPDAGKTVQPPVTDNSQPKTGNASPTINRPPSRLQASSPVKIKAEPQPTKRSLGRHRKSLRLPTQARQPSWP